MKYKIETYVDLNGEKSYCVARKGLLFWRYFKKPVRKCCVKCYPKMRFQSLDAATKFVNEDAKAEKAKVKVLTKTEVVEK